MDFTTTELLRAFIADNKQRDGGSWAGWGGSLVWRALRAIGREPRAYPSVGMAWIETRILSLDSSEAPAGAIHYWTDNLHRVERANAGVDITGGGTSILIASSTGTMVGEGLSIVDEHGYTERFDDHSYAGWALEYGKPSEHTLQAMVEHALEGKFESPVALRNELGETRDRTLPELMLLVLDAAEADARLLEQMGFKTARAVIRETIDQDAYALLRTVLAAVQNMPAPIVAEED